MTRTFYRTSDGQQVGESDAFDSRGRLRDGFSVRTPVMLRDGVPSSVIDEQRRANSAKYEARITSAWKNPSPQAPALDASAQDKAKSAYERYERRLQDAWRS